MSLRELHQGLAGLTPEQRALFARRLAESGWGPQGPEIVPRPATGEPVPASLVQQRLWLLDQMEPENPFYNLPLLCFRLRGDLYPDPLARCFQEIERRHESLRTVFEDRAGFPFQAILPPAPRPLPMVDFAGLPEPRREAAARALAREESRRLFDLARGPLWRTHLLRLGERDHLLLVTMHHIISDAWSLGVFYRELSLLYTAFVRGLPVPLPDPPVQYPDFALWQRERLQGERLEAELRFWREQLAGAPERLDLPLDRQRPAVRTYGGERLTLQLPDGLPDAFSELSHHAGASLWMILLAGYDLLLHRYSGQDDVVLGAPVAGRTHAETEGLIGFFVNTLVFRVRLGGDPTFRELLARVRDVVLDVYEHQELPFDRLVEELRPRRDPSYGPIFQAMISLQNTPSPNLSLPGLEVEPEGINNGTSQTDLVLFAGMAQGRLGILQLEYNTALFEPATVVRMERHLLSLYVAAMADPDRRIAALPMLSPAELEQLRGWESAAERDLPVFTLPGQFAEQAARTPLATAVVDGDRALTYGELDRRANALAHRLRSLGVGPEVRVALCVHRSLEMLVALLGILKAGGAYVPLDPAYPAERLEAMLEGAAVLLGAPELTGAVSAENVRRVDLETADEAESPPDSGLLPDHPAYVIYTSGSTGRPKGVVVTHADVARLFTATRSFFQLGPDDVWTLFHSFAFDFSVWEIWGALLHGGRLVVVPLAMARSAPDFHRLLASQGVTVLNQTPSAFHQLQAADAELPPARLALRWVIFGGEALDTRALAPWFERHGDQRPRLVNMYGITETTVHVTWRPVGRADTGSPRSRIGTPLPDLSLHLLGRRGEPVPVGVPGEIHVGGAGLARGYLHPDLTAERFVPDPFATDAGIPGARLYRTGDLARRLPDGDLEFLGRLDQQVKIRGFRIELGEIEAALARHPAVRECVAAVRELSPGDPGIVVWWVPAAGGRHPPGGDTAELRAFLQRRLPEHMLPAAFQLLDALPLTPSGKVDRRALPAPEREGSAPAAPPATEIEQAVAALWQDLLGVQDVGRQDDFFELGGHSLLATQLASRLRDRFRLDLSAQLVFQYPGLADMAAALDQAREKAAAAGPVPQEPVLTALPRRARPAVKERRED
jgi:amino acid adenylation domain-containing protein